MAEEEEEEGGKEGWVKEGGGGRGSRVEVRAKAKEGGEEGVLEVMVKEEKRREQ